ncbi:hypothetical protein D1007_45421 [Hordeum vulgare]|nr:hypothetical protein D1007_48603 [Hordeum vulgare]KAE8781380.1 hypothetical protein D1007_45421 [Hordeum vulgare]KAI5004677.1 hypothetical protein ZWY2020_031920 [Hordeum vulgare]
MSTAAGFQADATIVDMEGLSQIAELSLAGGSASPTTIHGQLARALWAVSSLTLVADVSAGLYEPARGPVFGGHRAAYYSVLAAILAVVVLEMAAAYWLPRSGAQDHGRVHAFANGLLRFAVVLLLVLVTAVAGFAITVKA